MRPRGRRSPPCRSSRRSTPFALRAAEERPARDVPVPLLASDAVRVVEPRADLGEVPAEVGKHARVLCPLAREHERERPRPAQRLIPEIVASPVADRPARRVRQLLDHPAEPLAQVVGRFHHQAEAATAGGGSVFRVNARSLSGTCRFGSCSSQSSKACARAISAARSGAASSNASLSHRGWQPGNTRLAESACSSRTAWALMPAKPNALTAARLGSSRPPGVHGRAASGRVNGLSASASRAWWAGRRAALAG